MRKRFICPCCNSLIASPPSPDALLEVRYGSQSRRILDHLVRSYPRGSTYEGLIEVAWGNARLPNDLMGNIRSMIKILRKKIKPYGWTISNGATGSAEAFYKLERLP